MPDNTSAPDSTQPSISDPSFPQADPTATDLPPVAPEAPPEPFTPSAGNNDNPEIAPLEAQIPESVNTPPVASATSSSFSFRDLLLRAREKIQFKKRKKLDKILELLNKKSKISNDDVQKLLYVSDATATRYLSILEEEGKIQQSGRTGKSVFYTKL